jgi:hypothetical protein
MVKARRASAIPAPTSLAGEPVAAESGDRWLPVRGGSPRRVEEDEDHVVGLFHRVLIVDWRKEMTPAAMKGLERHLVEHSRRARGRVVFFTVIEHGASLPSNEVRTLNAGLLRACPIQLSVLVFEGTGFQAATVRGVGTGIGLLARTPCPHRAFSSVGQAADWVEAQTVNDEAVVGSLLLSRAVRYLRQ